MPWLAPSGAHYGNLDNGKNVFIYYWNFTGPRPPPGWTSSFSGNAVQGNGIKMSNGEAAVANVLRIPAGNVIEANIHLTRLGVGVLLFGGDFRGNTITANYPLFSAATANQIDNAIALAFNGVTLSTSFSSNYAVNTNVTLSLLAATTNIIAGVSVQPT